MRDDTPSPERDEARSAAGHALATGDEAAPSDAGADPLAAILAGRGSHRRKFGTAYAVLGVLAAVAIAAFVALLIRGGPADARPWSTFEPAGQEIAAAQEIAAFVESRYLLEDGTPIVDVSADWLTLQSSPIEFISVEQPDINGRSDQLLIPV